jgi:AcrR family transcriptional regulator
MPKVGMQPIRRQQLIEATLTAIDQVGMADASIALIARLAGVSNGIISHYFQDKNGLIAATMRYLMNVLDRERPERRQALKEDSPRAHLAGDRRRQLRRQPGQRPGNENLAGLLGHQHAPPVVAQIAADQRSPPVFQSVLPVPPCAAAGRCPQRSPRPGGLDRWSCGCGVPCRETLSTPSRRNASATNTWIYNWRNR